MKLSRFVTLTALLLALLLNYSCDKSDKGGPPVNNPPQNITADVYGRVTDDNNVPVQGATVKAGTASTSTDVNGYFRFRNASLDKSNGFIKVEKEGFFQGSRTFTPNAGLTNYLSIQLIRKFLSGTFAAGSGGNITVSSGGSIGFPANAVVNASNNSTYTGNVSVYAYFINPASARFRDIMPGALRGVNTNNQTTGLKSYGMMAVELTGAGGEKLQLANGKPATITFPIPSTLQSQAPAAIPLWRFNDTTGLWKQEGSAAKQGTNYTGTVPHFSFWNCDDPFPVVDFAVTIKDQHNQPLRYTEVVLKIMGDTVNPAANGFTDSSGKVAGPVPVNKTMQMQVYNNCGLLIHTQQIGPFAANTDMGVVTVNNAAQVQVTISGTVVNCTGNPITNGVVNILLNGKNNRTTINNGSFSMVINRCEATAATAQLQAIDLGASQQGPVVNLSVTTGAANAGQLNGCGSPINQFLNYTVNGANYLLLTGEITAFRDNLTYVTGTGPGQSFYISFNFPGTTPGSYALNSLHLYAQKTYVKNGTINVNITEYGNANGYIEGNFSGTVKDTIANTTAPIVCSFRVKREY